MAGVVHWRRVAISVQSIISVDPLVCTLCQVFQQAELAGWWVSFKDFVMQPKVEIIQKINLAKFVYTTREECRKQTETFYIYSDNSEFFFLLHKASSSLGHGIQNTLVAFALRGWPFQKVITLLIQHKDLVEFRVQRAEEEAPQTLGTLNSKP